MKYKSGKVSGRISGAAKKASAVLTVILLLLSLFLSPMISSLSPVYCAYAESTSTDDEQSVSEYEAQSADEKTGQIISEVSEGTADPEPVTEEAVDGSADGTGQSYTDESDMLMMYMERQILGDEKPSDSQAVYADGGLSIESSDRRAKLKGNNKIIYNALAAEIKKIAAGSKKQAVVKIPLKKVLGKLKFTASDLGVSSIRDRNGKLRQSTLKAFAGLCSFDLDTIHYSLLADMPYELYWYDKSYERIENGTVVKRACSYTLAGSSGTLGYSYTGSYIRFNNDPVITFSFVVSADYSSSGKTGTYYLRSDLSSVKKAVSNAKTIAAGYAEKPDLDKLNGYREAICALTSYDHNYRAKHYGDPWQLIYVFDGDSSTEVVCEGYAKAFKFLCDISDFSSSSIKCRIVTGLLDLNTDVGHMWNIVHMNDGKNYIADLTNCDSGATGYPDRLFLRKYSGRTSGGIYSYPVSGGSLLYKYDSETENIYSSSELAMSNTEYKCPHNYNDLDDGTVTAYEVSDPETGELRPDGAVLTFSCKVCGASQSAEYGSAEEAEHARYELLEPRYTPAKVSLTSVTAGSKKATVKWKRPASDVTRYEIELTDTVSGKKKTVTVKQGSSSTISRTISKLKKRKYKIRVRAYKNASWQLFYGKWSSAKTVKII